MAPGRGPAPSDRPPVRAPFIAQSDCSITVRLAERAAAAWDRDEVGPLGPEDAGARLARNRAATLALIGAAVRERGRREGDDVVVELGAELIAQALDAAENAAEDVADQVRAARAAGRGPATARPASPCAAAMHYTVDRRETPARRRRMEEHRFERTHYRA
jgi:hypothetical protein